jgi:hypothetical protein
MNTKSELAYVVCLLLPALVAAAVYANFAA